jgi:hypothetical protein
MTFDLTVFPVDRPLTYAEATAEVQRVSGWRLGLGHDRRLDGFIAEMERRYPSLRGRGPDDPPCEFDVARGSIFLGLPWPSVLTFAPEACEVAFRHGLAVWDPQREVVGLPAPFADAPLGPDGLDEHVASANRMLGAFVAGAMSGGRFGEEATQRAISEQLRSVGARQFSRLGFEITPDIEAEVFADPTRYPPSLQTPERKAELLAGLEGATSSGDRHRAIIALGAWDPDPDVAAGLRPLLQSEDVFETGQAALGLARQGDITDLPGILDAVHRMSPADGGTAAAMYLPASAALTLAALAGPDAVAGVKARIASWRVSPTSRRPAGDADEALDAILARDDERG